MPTDTSPETKSDLMSKSLYYATFIPLVLVFLTFASHFVMGIIGHQELKDIIGVFGFGGMITAVLVFFAGIHDGTVSVLLLAKDKLFPKLPWWVVFLYAGFWPVVPRAMIWYGGGPFEWVEVLIFGGMAALAYWCHTIRPKLREVAS